MRILSTTALALALALGSTAAMPAAAKEKVAKPVAANYSPKVREAAVAAQNALAKYDLPGAQASIATAEQSIANDDDKYVVGQLYLAVAQKNQDQALLSKAVGMMIDSNKAPADQKTQLLTVRGKLAYQAKDYATAETALTAAQQAGSTDQDLVPVLVESMHLNGHDLAAVQLLSASVDKVAAAGQPAPDTWFQRGIAIGYQTKATTARPQINAAVADLTKKWVTAYPTKAHWRDTLIIYRDSNKLDAEQTLDLMRLLRTAGALNGQRDYMEYVDATYLRFPGEAKAVLDEGNRAGAIPAGDKNATEIKALVNGKVAADRASLVSAEKGARAAATGKNALTTADAYLGYGDYAKAIDLYKVALTKGGVDPATVNTRMGIALAKSGDAAGAKAAFAAVTGTRKPLADFWVTYLDHPPAGA